MAEMAWAPDYIDVEQLAEYVRITDSDDDTLLAPAISAASRAIDAHTFRQFGLVDAPEARYYTAQWNKWLCQWEIEIDDLMTTTGLLIKADLTGSGVYDQVITQYVLQPRNNAPKGKPWTRIVVRGSAAVQPTCREDGVEVFARPGWLAVPTVVEQACYLQASRFFKRRGAPFGVAGSPDSGTEMRLLAKVDPDVAVALRSVIRWWGAR